LNDINKNHFIDQKNPKCPACGCKHLYKKKDFNQTLGCLVIIVGAVFVPVTYGLSLVLLFLLDLFLYSRIKDSVECYKCKIEYKNVVVPKNFTNFDHHTAEIYEND
tara:strand:- start:51 stop:368 length:318 start_codon:yes stop_codon:yes gene_type:complete